MIVAVQQSAGAIDRVLVVEEDVNAMIGVGVVIIWIQFCSSHSDAAILFLWIFLLIRSCSSHSDASVLLFK